MYLLAIRAVTYLFTFTAELLPLKRCVVEISTLVFVPYFTDIFI